MRCSIYKLYVFLTVKKLEDDEKVFYEIDYPAYDPVEFEGEILASAEWADKSPIESLNFNNVDDTVDRRSFEGIYRLGKDGKPLNIKGRTGVVGRGILGKVFTQKFDF